jgi:hypothetical protein
MGDAGDLDEIEPLSYLAPAMGSQKILCEAVGVVASEAGWLKVSVLLRFV